MKPKPGSGAGKPRRGQAAEARAISVRPGAERGWSVFEDDSQRKALSYFPTKYAAVRHALRRARAVPRAEVRIIGDDGSVRACHSYRTERTRAVVHKRPA